MSTDITTKQHYVWRRYLCAWKVNADDKDIWTGFLKTKEVKKIALMGVAQCSHFYKLESLTDEEIDFLKQYTERLSPDVKSIAEVILAGYMLFADIKKVEASGKIKFDSESEHELKKAEIASFEKIQSSIELMGDELLKCQSIKDVEAIAEEGIYEILYYLMVQYLRTRAMKDRFVNSLSDRKNLQDIGQKCWPFFNLVTAMQVIERMVKNNDSRFTFVYNKSEVDFITGDQPVINALGDITDEKGEVKELELYYPLSPKAALVVAFGYGAKFSEKEVGAEYVMSRNAMIKKESMIHIFAKSEKVLSEILS